MNYYYPNASQPIYPYSPLLTAQNGFCQSPDQYSPQKLKPSTRNQLKSNSFKHGMKALEFFAVGLLLHRLPASKSSFSMISSDWKDWARMALGVVTVGEVNKSLEWQPKPWQLALETITILSPLSNGLFNLKAWRQFPLLAIFVPLLVQTTDWLNQWAQHKLDDNQSHISPWVPKLIISVSATLAGLLALRSIVKTNTYRQFTGQSGPVNSNQVIGAEAVICTRCGGQHLLCMSELGDMAGSLGAWFKGLSHKEETR